MQSKKYKTIQVPNEDYDLLVEYCEAMGLKIGKFVGRLIRENCIPMKKKPNGVVMRVEKERGQ